MTTREYEALIIFKASASEPDMARLASQCEEQVKKCGGHIDASQNMGRRRLAFRISRQTEGCYHLLRFHAPTEQVVELERIFRLNEAIVRFMILTEEELAPLIAAAPAAAGAESVVSSAATHHTD